MAPRKSQPPEIQRKTGMDVFKKAGIDLPVYKEFTDYDAAIKFVEKEGRGFVSKPCYDEADKNLTYLGKTPESLIYMLQRWKKEQRLKGPFILRELIQAPRWRWAAGSGRAASIRAGARTGKRRR